MLLPCKDKNSQQLPSTRDFNFIYIYLFIYFRGGKILQLGFFFSQKMKKKLWFLAIFWTFFEMKIN